MDNEIRLDDPLPDDVLASLGALYTAPSDAGYWAGLEARVMAQVAGSAGVAGAGFGGRQGRQHYSWSRAALAVAAAALLVIGALIARSHTKEIQAAYNSLIKPSATESLSVPNGALGERSGSESRDATFHDVITH